MMIPGLQRSRPPGGGGGRTFEYVLDYAVVVAIDLVAWIIPKNILSLVFSTLGVVQMPHKFNAARRHKFDKAGLINYKAIIKVREHIIKPQLSEQIDIQHNSILPQWNYTIRPSLTTCANPN